MIRIASYSLRGHIVRVKLKCTCGNSKIFEVKEEGETIYFCNKCRSRKTLEELKKEASTYWRTRDWIVECEPDQRTQPRIHIDYPIELTVKATRLSPPYCVLHGKMVVLSESGMLAIVEDFSESYFQDITTAYRHVEITLQRQIPGFPTRLTGRIVGVRFRRTELPKCRLGIGFSGLSDETIEMLRKHIADHIKHVTPES